MCHRAAYCLLIFHPLKGTSNEQFNLHTPTRILFGKGAIENLREQIPADARVLITYGGGSVKKNGVLDQVIAR
jgi:alcohol dehydrogenase YqhD (iron-dependent ADH family)